MNAYPSTPELLGSVTRFLRDELLPTLEGAAAFNVRVSVNALDVVLRELTQLAAAEQREHARLRELLDADQPLEELRELLCEHLAAGMLPLDNAQLRAHLRATAIDRLGIDQPSYSAYRSAIAQYGTPAIPQPTQP